MKSGDLVFNEIEGVFYKKFTDVPFSGTVTGKGQGKLKNGKKEGPWVSVNYKGQLEGTGTYKNGMKNGHWVSDTEESGMYRNGKLVK